MEDVRGDACFLVSHEWNQCSPGWKWSMKDDLDRWRRYGRSVTVEPIPNNLPYGRRRSARNDFERGKFHHKLVVADVAFELRDGFGVFLLFDYEKVPD